MKPAPFRYEAPTTVEEVTSLLHRYGDECKLLAGGQSLGPLLNLRMSTPAVLVDLSRVAALRFEPFVHDGEIRMAALTTYQELVEDPQVRQHLPLFMEAIPHIGHQAIRNAGTLGGSVAHADPAAEMPAVLLALGARVGVRGVGGERVIPVDDFFTGVFSTSLAEDEVVTWVSCPLTGMGHGSAWLEVAPRHGDYATVGIGAHVVLAGDHVDAVRVCLAGVADTPYLARAVDDLVGAEPSAAEVARAARAVSAEIRPRSDLVASTPYKRHLAEVLTSRALLRSLDMARATTDEGSCR